jgi:glycine dehydrogenase subunit 1
MRYIPNSDFGRREMLREIGASSLEELLVGIPSEVRLQQKLNLPAPLSEPELLEKFKSLEQRNAAGLLSFLGAGVNFHFIPALIDPIVSRAEFLTSYTPYQAEISQGTLQAIFEFQTFICQLTGMEVSNASMYDGSTALAEALLMAARITQRSRLLVARTVHPEYRIVAGSLCQHQNLKLDEIGYAEDGRIDYPSLKSRLDSEIAAVVVQSPNFFGNLETLRDLAELAHQSGALFIVNIAEALSLGILASPGSVNADIVCGEAQSFGVPPLFGGPHVGFLATAEKYMRNLPGRLVGKTVDSEGKRGFVLTLSTREQHIRREKATSNICTNQSLIALIATIYLSTLGKEGLREVALQNVAKTQYALSRIKEIPGVKICFESPRFNELVIRLPKALNEISEKFTRAHLVPGLPLQDHFPELKDSLLISVTETKSKAEIDLFARLLNEFVQ